MYEGCWKAEKGDRNDGSHRRAGVGDRAIIGLLCAFYPPVTLRCSTLFTEGMIDSTNGWIKDLTLNAIADLPKTPFARLVLPRRFAENFTQLLTDQSMVYWWSKALFASLSLKSRRWF